MSEEILRRALKQAQEIITIQDQIIAKLEEKVQLYVNKDEEMKRITLYE